MTLKLKDLRPYAETASVIMIAVTATATAAFSLLGLGTWGYNKISGSHITMGDAGCSLFLFGGLLAEWAGIIRGGSKD